MAKLPRLDEVFIVQSKPINVGSAYSLKKETRSPNKKVNFGTRKHGFTMNEAEFDNVSLAPQNKLKPDFEKLVKNCAADILSKKPDKLELEDMLRDLAHAIEGAEGEDPKELDPGGPEPGTTGGK